MATSKQLTRFAPYLLWVFICHASALFEDQVGKFDWKQEYIGKPAQFQILANSRKIVVTTEQNVLASLAPRNGETVWRQVHEDGPAGHIESLVEDGDHVWTVSNTGGIVRHWDVDNGYLLAEYGITITEPINVVKSYHQLILDNSQLMRVEIFSEPAVQLSSYNISSGELLWARVTPTSWNVKKISCEFTSSLIFACIDRETKFLHSLRMEKENTFLVTPIPSLVSTPVKNVEIVILPGILSKSFPFVALKLNRDVHLVLKVEQESVRVVKDLHQMLTVDIIESNAGLLLFGISKGMKKNEFLFHVINLETGEEMSNIMLNADVLSDHGNPQRMWMYSIPKKEGGVAYRALVVFEDHAILLIQNSGKVLWAREESLASVINVEMVDLPLSDSDAQFEQEFRSDSANIFTMFVKRITTQLLQLETFLVTLLSGLQSKDAKGEMNSIGGMQLTRDEFNLHKIILLLSKPGKIFGIDSSTGEIVWQQFIPNMAPFENKDGEKMLLLIQRTTAYFPHHPQCLVVGKHKVTGKGLLFPFHPISGMPLSDGSIQLDFEILQAMLLPQSDEEYLRPVLFLDQDKKVHVYPSSGIKVAKSLSKSLFIFSVEAQTGLLTGYSLAYSSSKELSAVPVWEINFPPSVQTITRVILKRSQEHVHSQGRVMGDRSVMYKYLNPNLAAVLTVGEDSQQKSFFNIFLLDAITGNIIYSASHKRCRGPLHVVHSENWIVYSYHSEKSRRTEMAVLELYEGKWQSNSTAFSSLDPPQSPMVERQAYIFPPGLTAAAVTLTEKGITSKFLLFALPSGRLLELPKALLDPRRPLVPTQEHREEGIYPYAPELPVPSESIINYNQSIHNVRGIYTAAAGLESTCLVLAYGLDLFYTRVTPSRTFDVLKDDFDHYLISAMLLALIFASYLTRRLAARKALHQAWK